MTNALTALTARYQWNLTPELSDLRPRSGRESQQELWKTNGQHISQPHRHPSKKNNQLPKMNPNTKDNKWNSSETPFSLRNSEVFHVPTLEFSPAAMTLDTCLQCRKSPNFPFTTLVTTNRTTTQAELPGTASLGRESRSQSSLS